VNNFVTHIDWRTMQFDGTLYDIDSAINARAKPSRLRKHNLEIDLGWTMV
jgi:hypothetical protein